jgi:hypothetical protein
LIAIFIFDIKCMQNFSHFLIVKKALYWSMGKFGIFCTWAFGL